jgi:hypothetical protein
MIDFLYLALGTMPLILQYKENGVDIDLSKILACRFFPSMIFFGAEHLIDISNKTLNEKTLGEIKAIIRSKPFEIFWAFTALTSSSYERIYCEHRISLLLHCFEGYIYNKNDKYKELNFKGRVKEIINVLTDEELAVFKRARNAKKPTKAKHASISEYNDATGFEAVLGYLYLVGDNDRLNFILNKGKTNES